MLTQPISPLHQHRPSVALLVDNTYTNSAVYCLPNNKPTDNMKTILNLPEELQMKVFDHFVKDNNLRRAMVPRQVCSKLLVP